MSNIEEDIKILKQFNSLKINSYAFKFVDISYPKLQQAIDNILSEREQDKKRIKELEEEREIVGIPVKNKRDGRIGVVLHQWESGSVAVLENINPRIINTHDSWSTLEIITDEVKQTKTKDDSIPRQKVKDKIDELKKHYNTDNNIRIYTLKDSYELQATVLEELLEEDKQ